MLKYTAQQGAQKSVFLARYFKTDGVILLTGNIQVITHTHTHTYIQSILIHIYTMPICVLSSSVITYPTSIQIPAMTPNLAANTT